MKYRRNKVLIMYSPGLEQKMVELPTYVYVNREAGVTIRTLQFK